MADNIPSTPEPPCEACQDKTAKKMAGYAMGTMACYLQKGDMQKACLALIVPLEDNDSTVDPEEVLSEIMLLGDNGKSIDDTAELLTAIIEGAAKKAAAKANADAGNPM